MNVDEENNDSENENQEENMEEPSEENTDENSDSEVQINQSEDIPEELTYEEKLNQYFDEVEKGFGIDQANKIRAKINAAKQLSMFLDSMEFEKEYREKIFELLQKTEDDSQLIQERTLQCIDKSMESLAKHDEIAKSFSERVLKSIEDSDKRDEELSGLVKELAQKIDARSEERHQLKIQLLRETK